MRIIYLSYEQNIISEHEIMVVNINDINSRGINSVVEEINNFDPHYVIEREFNDGKAFYNELYKMLPNRIKIFWAIDSHLNLERYIRYSRNVDYMFCAISKDVDIIQKRVNIPVRWLPLYFPGKISQIKETSKHDISFVGNFKPHFFKKRREYLDFLKKEYGDNFNQITDYKNMAQIINNSKINFNCSLDGDMNFRVFESLGYGSHLVTDNVPDILKIKGLKDFITIYNNKDELKSKLDVLLTKKNYTFNKEQSQHFIEENHCLKNRLNSIINMTKTNKQEEF